MSATSFFIVLLLLSSPLLLCASGDEASDTSLEARDIGTSFSEDEIVSITWRNINTNNTGLLDDLHESTYQIERLTMVDTTIASTSIIASEIPACEIGDNNAACSAKNHSAEWMPPEGTNGSFKYRITTFTPNGPTTNFTSGLSQTENSQTEIVSSHWGPTNISANYSAQSQSTIITWDNLPNLSQDTQIWVWRHSQPATRSNWDSLNKTAIQIIFDSSITSYTKDIESGIERSVYYSVIYNNGTFSDTRFMRDNTLTSPTYEDTIIPELVAQLSATFDSQSGITSLHWDSGALDTNLVTTIWRSPQPISNIYSEIVVEVGSIDGRLTSYDHNIGAGELGYFWYAVTLKDSVGNSISSLSPQHPTAGPIFESTVGEANSTIPSNVSAQQIDEATISITWNDVSTVSNATYHIWASYDGPITQISFNAGEVDYLGNATAEIMLIYIIIPQDTERNIWYAVTVEGAWGGPQAIYENQLIVGGINSINSPIFADNLAPEQISDFNATSIGPNQSISLDWAHVDTAIEYQLWVTTEFSFGPWWNVSEDDGWTLLQTYNATGGTNNESIEYTGELPVLLALVSVDSLGHANHSLYGEHPVEVITQIFEVSCPDGYVLGDLDNCIYQSQPDNSSTQELIIDDNSTDTGSNNNDEVASANSVVDNVFPMLAIALLLFVLISTFSSRERDDTPVQKVFEEE